MSRVYDAFTAPGHSVSPVVPNLPEDETWANEPEAPFIEIGGPGGPIFSSSPTAAVPLPTKPVSKVETARQYPRLADSPAPPAYLSVHFYDFADNNSAIPAGTPDLSLVAYHHPEHAVSTEYRTLRHEIQKQLSGAASRLLLFVAPTAESGTTTVLLNLAITLAKEGPNRVLVVDASVSRPAVATRLGVKPKPGLAEVLSHQVPLTLAIQPSIVPQLSALTLGSNLPASFERELPVVLTQLRMWYDWVLVDGGNAVPGAGSLLPGSAADAIYLVIRDEAVAKTDLVQLQRQFKTQGGLLRGYITTRL
jgi:Mrp family chromosome partitioning ATPase